MDNYFTFYPIREEKLHLKPIKSIPRKKKDRSLQ